MSKYTLAELRKIQEDDELDLSACSIQDFPTAIVQLTRLTYIDLSSNNLSHLPESFGKMTKLIRLDLGNNKLPHLPDSIGQLSSLQHLNLYNNKLEDLPLSFSNLQSLKWLDLKKNPMNSKLAAIAGPCSTDAECKIAAKQVVHVYMADRKKAIDQQKVQEAKMHAKVQKAKEEEKIRKYQEKKKREVPKDVGISEKEVKQSKTTQPTTTTTKAPKAAVKQTSSKTSTNDGNKTTKKSCGIVRCTLGFLWSCVFYLTIATVTAATIAIGLGCHGSGTPIPGSAPLCKDFSLIGGGKKPSAQFAVNLKNTYAQVFQGYHNQIKPHVAPLQSQVQKQWKKFSKTDIGGRVEKTAYQVHTWLVEQFVKVQRFVKQQSDALAAWWKKDGQKTFGAYLDGFIVGLKIVLQVVIDVAQNVAALIVHFANRGKTFVNAWIEGGFNAAVNTLNH